MKTTDLEITNPGHMGFFTIAATSKAGRKWLKQNVPSQEHGVAYSDDRRLAWDIYQGALIDGLRVTA